jgi:hypothetical protein
MLEKRPLNPVMPHGCLSFFSAFVSTLGIPATRLTLVFPNEYVYHSYRVKQNTLRKHIVLFSSLVAFLRGRHLHWGMGAG